jgi:hypothetical protein
MNETMKISIDRLNEFIMEAVEKNEEQGNAQRRIDRFFSVSFSDRSETYFIEGEYQILGDWISYDDCSLEVYKSNAIYGNEVPFEIIESKNSKSKTLNDLFESYLKDLREE